MRPMFLLFAVQGLADALLLRGQGHGKDVEAALIRGWRTHCELALQLDRYVS